MFFDKKKKKIFINLLRDGCIVGSTGCEKIGSDNSHASIDLTFKFGTTPLNLYFHMIINSFFFKIKRISFIKNNITETRYYYYE